MVCVDNTDRDILEELQRLYGGKLIAKKKTQEHHRQAWSWRVFGAASIIAMLRQVHPYMRSRVKAERTRMLIEEYKQVTSRNGHYTPGTRAAKGRLRGALPVCGSRQGRSLSTHCGRCGSRTHNGRGRNGLAVRLPYLWQPSLRADDGTRTRGLPADNRMLCR